MALIKCAECGHEVADTAKACPSCGYNTRSKRVQRWKSFLILIPLAVLAGFLATRLIEKPTGYYVGALVFVAIYHLGWEVMGKRNIK